MIESTTRTGPRRRLLHVLSYPVHNAATLLLCTLITAPTAMISGPTVAQTLAETPQSIARQWNEVLLSAIRNDFARPTVHARNLFHSAAASFDAWALFDENAKPYYLSLDNNSDAQCAISTAELKLLRSETESVGEARRISISFAQFRFLTHRFQNSPGIQATEDTLLNLFFGDLGLDVSNTSTDITGPTPFAALGNRIAACIINATADDGSNEAGNYANMDYEPVNSPMNPSFPGTPALADPNRWQPLQLDTFVDQSGNQTDTPIFLGAEWGRVTPFALDETDVTLYQRDDTDYPVYHDPGLPALLDDSTNPDSDYQWGHSLVAIWSSHLDPDDGVLWDISPGNLGNTGALPDSTDDLQHFYQRLQGGSSDLGHPINPATGKPYARQLVPRGDYTRVLAEFWADGPDSETPPGHWFAIYNEAISDHPEFEKRWRGRGEILDDLTFDVLTYFALGGAMHDSAVAAWSIKGWYDYIRPVSALRYLSTLGQASDPAQINYNMLGIPLEPGYIELVKPGDVLAGNGNRNVGKVKVLAWRGPNVIRDPITEYAGVDWILLENWMPYQRPTFVTPPFAGYVSGHSTFSRAAAEILAKITGDEFFPGGMAEFVAQRNRFLVFEEGPSVNVRLQWATYRDASDQTSLSRIWGGIHPPVDDIPGRKIGVQIAQDAFVKAQGYYNLPEPANDPAVPAAEGPQASTDDPITRATSSGSGSGWLLLGLWWTVRVRSAPAAIKRKQAELS